MNGAFSIMQVRTRNIFKVAALLSLPLSTLATSADPLPAHVMTASRIAISSTSSQLVGVAATPGRRGMWTVTAAGTVTAYSTAQSYGSITFGLTRPIVGMASTPDGKGYWLVASDGGIFTFGDATFYGTGDALGPKRPSFSTLLTVVSRNHAGFTYLTP